MTYKERIEALEELQDTLRDAVDQARELVADTDEEDRAAVYWVAHLEGLIGDEDTCNPYDTTIKSTIDALFLEGEDKDNETTQVVLCPERFDR